VLKNIKHHQQTKMAAITATRKMVTEMPDYM